MKLSQFKQHLAQLSEVSFTLPSGEHVPAHYHITEVGQINKHFIDCGGKVRKEMKVGFQLWHSDDLDHRMNSQKVLDIIAIAEDQLALEDADIEVEFQSETIGKYGLEFSSGDFRLTTKMTACLAPDKCGVPSKEKVDLSNLIMAGGGCEPGSGCC